MKEKKVNANARDTLVDDFDCVDNECEDCQPQFSGRSGILYSNVDESLISKGIVFLEDEMTYPGSTLLARKLILDIASEPKEESQTDVIELYINSGGGEAPIFLSLFDIICIARTVYKKKVSTIVNGIAASAAALVLQSGRPRLATKNSFLMLHEMSLGFEGKYTNAQNELVMAKKWHNMIMKIWADSMSISIKELNDLLNGKDVYFTAKEAKKIGLIDDII